MGTLSKIGIATLIWGLGILRIEVAFAENTDSVESSVDVAVDVVPVEERVEERVENGPEEQSESQVNKSVQPEGEGAGTPGEGETTEDQNKKEVSLFDLSERDKQQGSLISPTNKNSEQDTTRTIVSLFLFLAMMLGVTWYIKKQMKVGGVLGNHPIKLTSYMSLGNKEKVALIRVRDKEVLIGVTSQNIAKLHVFDVEEPLTTNDGQDIEIDGKAAAEVPPFKKLLNAIYQGKPQPEQNRTQVQADQHAPEYHDNDAERKDQ